MKYKSERRFEITGHILMTVYSLLAVFPLVLLFVASFSSERSIVRNGYTLFPSSLSLDAYRYLLTARGQILNAYGVTVLVTFFGTMMGLCFTILLAYVLSRRDVPFQRYLNFFVFFSMIFNGGLVPAYLMWTEIFHIKNTIWGQILPALLVNGFNVFIARTYISRNVPVELVEAGKIDGAGEFRIFFSVVAPLCKPIMVTVGLFTGIDYWNNWTNGLYYISDSRLYTVQNVLTTMMNNLQFLSQNSGVAARFAGAAAKAPSTTVRMAIAVVGLLPILIIYPFIQRYFTKGIALGAVKG